jgi:hypothetical protein
MTLDKTNSYVRKDCKFIVREGFSCDKHLLDISKFHLVTRMSQVEHLST